MSEPSVEKRFCRQCLTTKPITEFRLRKRHGTDRLRQCNTCHSLTERMRRASRRSSHARAIVAKYALDLKNAKNHQEIVLLTSAVIKHFGGLDRFLGAWLRQFDAARRDKPGSKKVLDFFLAVGRLREYCEANGAAEPSVSQMSDEQLNQRVAEQIQGLIQHQPELAVDAARQLGWTIIPPDRPNCKMPD